MSRAEKEPEGSPAAGACVLVVLGGGVAAGVFAASPTAGVLSVWGVGAAALWRAARRRVSDSSATPPPEGATPTVRVLPGQRDSRGIRRVTREGMTIFYDDTEDRHTVLPQDR